MRRVLVMVANDLRRRLRDRSALVTAFVAPFALASIISVALGGTTGGFEATIGVVDSDGSDVSRGLAGQLLAGPGGGGGPRGTRTTSPISLVARQTEEAAAAQVADRELDAALVFPAGFGSALATGRPLPVRVVRDADRPVSGDVAASIARGLVARLDAAQLSVAVVASTAAPSPGRLPELAARAGQADLPIALRESAPGGDLPLAAYFGPSMAMVFLFLTVGLGARSLLEERRTGTLARLRSAPITPAGIVAAKTVSVLVLGLASILTLWLATSLLFGASWGSPPLVLALCGATVLTVAGISALVTAVARTEQQAEGLTSMVTFTLAVLGGNFVPPRPFPACWPACRCSPPTDGRCAPSARCRPATPGGPRWCLHSPCWSRWPRSPAGWPSGSCTAWSGHEPGVRHGGRQPPAHLSGPHGRLLRRGAAHRHHLVMGSAFGGEGASFEVGLVNADAESALARELAAQLEGVEVLRVRRYTTAKACARRPSEPAGRWGGHPTRLRRRPAQ